MPTVLLFVGCDSSHLAEKCEELTKENEVLRKEIKSLNIELIRLAPERPGARQVEHDEADSVRQKMRNLMIGQCSEPVVTVQIEVDYIENAIFVNGAQTPLEGISNSLLKLKASSDGLSVQVYEHRNAKSNESHSKPSAGYDVLKREDILHQIKKAGIDQVRFLIGSP